MKSLKIATAIALLAVLVACKKEEAPAAAAPAAEAPAAQPAPAAPAQQ